MPTPTTAIVVAVIAALASLSGSLTVEILRRRSAARIQRDSGNQQRELERLKDELTGQREAASKAEQAAEVMARYRNPLARSAYDLQSRIANIYLGFRGRRDPDYFRDNTLFVFAEFLGWLEIVRREVQFLDLAPAGTDQNLQRRVDRVRQCLAETSGNEGMDDPLYLYRGEQRAIGEMMIVDNPATVGPAHQCLGYAKFVVALDGPDFARWFERFGKEIEGLTSRRPRRLVHVQHALVDLLDVLDPDHVRFPEVATKIGFETATG